MRRRQVLKALLATIAGGAIGWSTTASARRGRRAGSSSVAGSRRRTHRRTRRRTRRRIHRNMRLTSLPYGCTVTRMRGSITYYYCSGIWYEPVYQGTTVIYIVNEIEPGAETNVEFEELD
jgi:hypothetical protein